jgi:D-alanine--poly(phosphoribitol) ligase subunit 2
MLVVGHDVREQVLQVLQDVTESDEVLTQPDLPLYGTGLLDSLGTVTLIVALGERFDLTVSPAEFDPHAWATPAHVVADIERRLAARLQAKA